jgi:hypothetical protein
MAKIQNWQDDYWLLLMQIYLRRPVGIKPLYSKVMVELSLELHITPQVLNRQMRRIDTLDTPRIERIWQEYSRNPKRLTRAVELLRSMMGFNSSGDFYEGVEVEETFERDFRPLEADERLMPVSLVLILDLYFQLTPNTMVSETPEVQQLAHLLKVPVSLVVEVLDIYQHCDPYLNRHDVIISQLLMPCQQIWQRYGNADTRQLAADAEQFMEYFK